MNVEIGTKASQYPEFSLQFSVFVSLVSFGFKLAEISETL